MLIRGTGTRTPLDAFKSVIVILLVATLSLSCKHNTNNTSLKTFNSSRRLFSLISNAGAYALCNMFACLFFSFLHRPGFNVTEVETFGFQTMLFISGAGRGALVQRNEIKGGGHLILKLWE